MKIYNLKNYCYNKMKRIIFVRHGESTENVASIAGKSYDKNKITLTKNGKNQAKITGEYLNKVFGKFDKVYSSPVRRCIETSNNIIKQINYKDSIIIDDNLAEMGYISNNLDGLSKEEKQKIFDNTKLDNLPKDKIFNGISNWEQFEKKINETKNPFDKLQLTRLFPRFEKMPAFDVKPNSKELKGNLKRFFKNVKKTKYNNILVITHGGCIGMIQKILCNIDETSIEFNKFGDKNNCCIVCVGLENNKYSLVAPASIKHLEK